MKGQTDIQVLKLIASTFHQIHRSLIILWNAKELIKTKSIGSAGNLIYITDYTHSCELINKFYQQISTKYSHEDIIAAEEYIEDQVCKDLFLDTYNAVLTLRKEARFCNAKTFLSLFGLDYHETAIDNYIRHIKKGNLYKFIKNEPWDELFIECLAVLYVIISYQELAFSSPKLLSFKEVIDALLKKEDKPEDIINQLNHLKAYSIELFEKLELDVFLADVYPDVKAEDYPFDGLVYIPWEFVSFNDKYFLIDHPKFYTKGGSDHSYKYYCEDSKAAFNHIKLAIKRQLPPIMVECNRGIITKVINAGDISICVTTLETNKFPPKIKINPAKVRKQKTSLTLEEYINRKNGYKSQFLDYLAQHLYFDSTIYYCRECRLNSSNNATTYEDAFIFCLSNTVLLYENVLDKRASVVFQIEPGKIEECADVINGYFSSDKIENKREKLANDITQFTESGIRNYKRICHNSFSDWESELLCYLRNR